MGDQVHVGRIVIGEDVHIGNGYVIGHDVAIGDGAEIGDLAGVPAGDITSRRTERWDGSPARPVGTVDKSSLPEHPEIGRVQRAVQLVGYFFFYNFGMVVGLLHYYPGLLRALQPRQFRLQPERLRYPGNGCRSSAWPSAFVLVLVSMAIVVAALDRAPAHRARPLFDSSGRLLFQVDRGSLDRDDPGDVEPLLCHRASCETVSVDERKVGRGTEISASFAGRYPLIEMGENNFIGDEAVFGDEDIYRGWMTLERMKEDRRSLLLRQFRGRSARIGHRGRCPDRYQVAASGTPARACRETWFGSPAISLPTREKVTLSANWTYEPPRAMRLWRTVFEAMHTSFPTAAMITMAYIAADMIATPFGEARWGQALAIFMVAGIATSLLMYLLVFLAKWTLMGVYKPIKKPMWSWWAMRTEAVAVFYGGLASKVLLEYFRGTPLLPWLLRPLGTKVGKGAWINSVDLTEFDCVTIGDHVALNMFSCPQLISTRIGS